MKIETYTEFLFVMIRRILLSASVIALSLITCQTSAKASIEFPESCRMGSCRQATLESKEALRSNALGTLYLINQTIESYPQDNYNSELAEQDYQRFVNYYGTDFVVEQDQQYVFCSKSVPSVLFESEDRYYVWRLALFDSPSTASRSAHQTYLATCHNLAGPDYFSLSVQTMLIREGYTTRYVKQDNQFNVANPLEIMELYPESY